MGQVPRGKLSSSSNRCFQPSVQSLVSFSLDAWGTEVISCCDQDSPELISDSSRTPPPPCRQKASTNAVLDQEESAAREAPLGAEPAPWDLPSLADRNSPLQDLLSQASSAAQKLGSVTLPASDVIKAVPRPASQRGGLCKENLQVSFRQCQSSCSHARCARCCWFFDQHRKDATDVPRNRARLPAACYLIVGKQNQDLAGPHAFWSACRAAWG